MTLYEKLNSLPHSTSLSVRKLEELFVHVHFRKGTLLSASSATTSTLYFIESGQVHCYLDYNTESYCSWVIENGFLLLGKNHHHAINLSQEAEFLTDSEGWMLNLSAANSVASNDAQLACLLLEMMLEIRSGFHTRELLLGLKYGEQRFTYLQQINHNLVYRIPHKICALMLNLNEKYLYEIKKKHLKR
jgi:hypothetical protein